MAMKSMILLAGLVLVVGVALADELPIDIKNAPGRATVESNCGTCHSLDYIRTNSPYPTAQVWGAEVNKMINAFGADIKADDAKAIIEYLSKNYGS
jgi:sulfite dehydrogenase (cytochrome) subunit B